MLELLEKIRSRKILFLLLIAPLLFTPVKDQVVYNSWVEWEYRGIAIGGPFLSLPDVLVWKADWEMMNNYSNSDIFIDWGRIAYWELWVLLIYFCMIPWLKKTPEKRRA